jgi:hypothetical protein
MTQLRKFKSLVNEKGYDYTGSCGTTITIYKLVKDYIYESNQPFFVDDDGCPRDIKDMLKSKKVIEIYE